MTKEISRPRSVASDELDLAVNEALMRVTQARELSQAECTDISGGLITIAPIRGLPIGPTVGMFPVEPIYTFSIK